MASVAGFKRLWRRRQLGGPELTSLLVKAGANLTETADLAAHYFREWPDDGTAYRASIKKLEERGDEITRRLILGLHARPALALDRADLYRLARAIDDVVDDIEEAVEETALHQIEAPMEQAQALADVLCDAAQGLEQSLRALHEGDDVDEHTRLVRQREQEADRIYRAALAALFHGGVDPMLVLKWKDVLTAIEEAIDRARNAADLVSGLKVKYA